MSEERSLFISPRHPEDISPGQDGASTTGARSSIDKKPLIYAGKKRKSAGSRQRRKRISSDLTSEKSSNHNSNMLDSGTAFQFAAASSSGHADNAEPSNLSYVSEPAPSTVTKGVER